MTLGHRCRPAPPTGGRRERGAALIEMALVVGLLTFLLFGIITVGVTLGFKQSMTQAIGDAARAAAVAPRDQAVERAEAAANRSASAWGERCNEGDGLSCSFVIDDCVGGDGECMVIELRYDLRGHPRIPTASLADGVLPDEMTTRAIVEVSA